MIVTLDGERLGNIGAPSMTLAGLAGDVRREHLVDRVLVEVAIDGQTLVDDTLTDRLSATLDGCEQIDFVSAEPRALAADALRQVSKRLAEAADAHVAVAHMLQSGQVAPAVQEFAGLLANWHECQRAIVDASGLLERDISDWIVDGRSLPEHFASLAGRLREIRDAFDARDFVLLADWLEFEMPQVCRVWSALTESLAEQSEARS